MAGTRRLSRITGGIRRWRARSADRIELRPDLASRDLDTVALAIGASISDQGGEVAGRRRAQYIAEAYSDLDPAGRLRFCELLTERFGYDEAAIAAAVKALPPPSDQPTDPTPHDQRPQRYRELAAALQPRYRTLLRRFASMENGFKFLIGMREDVMDHRRVSPAMNELDLELRDLLASWFDVSLLKLERLTWDTPASTLELLIRYEAVHEITSWEDLRRRLGPGRRCYAFMHPAMPGDPLIFVEVALTDGMADSVVPFLNASDPTTATAESDADTAIFYSISNCHRGLAGVSLGDFLIKSVVQALSAELPNIERFATLSPLPGFGEWLHKLLADEPSMSSVSSVSSGGNDASADLDADTRELLRELTAGPLPDPDDVRLESVKPAVMRLAARYVVLARRPSGRALDPVENFHLSNGARAERLNWMANPTPTSWQRSLGVMINYRYRIQSIERNHDLYVNAAEVVAGPAVTALLADSP